MTAVIQVLLSILMSLGIAFTTANVGDSIADVLEQQPPETKQYIERWLRNPTFMATISTIAMTNDMIEYATGGEVKEVSAEDMYPYIFLRISAQALLCLSCAFHRLQLSYHLF